MRLGMRIRLSTMLLLVVVLALLVRFFILRQREAQLQLEISPYRNPARKVSSR